MKKLGWEFILEGFNDYSTTFMLDSVSINRCLSLELQKRDLHNASGARDGPPRPRPLKMGEGFVPGFKRRRHVTSSYAFYQHQGSVEVFSKVRVEWNYW